MSVVPTTVRIRKALENAIVDGRYPPGLKLDPEQLAHEFDCSRPLIQEALQQLQESGLVRVVPKRGTFAMQWNVNEVTGALSVRRQLTCPVALPH